VRVSSIAYEDLSVPVSDSKNGKPLNEPLGGAQFTDVTFSPDGKYILTGSYSGAAQVWDIQPVTPLIEPIILQSSVKYTQARFSPDGSFLLLTDDTGQQQQCFESETGKLLTTVAPTFAKHFSKWENATGTRRFVNIENPEPGEQDDDQFVDKHLIDVASGKPVFPELRTNRGRVAFSSDGRRLLIGHFTEARSDLEIRSADTGARVREPILGFYQGWFSPEGDKVIMYGLKGLVVLDIGSGRELTDPFKSPAPAAATLIRDSLVVVSLENRPELYRFRIQLDHAPPLLADIAEAVGQLRLNEYSAPESRYVPLSTLRELAEKLVDGKTPPAFLTWAKWFFTPRQDRPIAPGSGVSLRDYIQRCLDRATADSLHEAALLAVGNKELLAKIAATSPKQFQRDYVEEFLKEIRMNLPTGPKPKFKSVPGPWPSVEAHPDFQALPLEQKQHVVDVYAQRAKEFALIRPLSKGSTAQTIAEHFEKWANQTKERLTKPTSGQQPR